jgi:DNA invertase Pin-like site-specific DNA recombinase
MYSKTPTEQPKRAAIYTRISRDKTGKKAGVKRQRQDCEALAASLGWEVVARFSDNDISAYSGKRRPGFEHLPDAIQTGAVDAVLCWHTDRLHRSMKDLERFIEIADAAALSIKTVTSGEIDLSTSAGRLVARILGDVACQESEHHGERRVRACVQKARRGRWETANRPFGYTMKGKPKEPEAQAIRDAVDDVWEGKSIQQVAREWNAAGLPTTRAGSKHKVGGRTYTVAGTWSAPRVRRVLVNPRYAGLKVHRGAVAEKEKDGVRTRVKGKWTALIDVDTHDRVVAYLMKSDAPGRNRPPGYACRRFGHVLRNAAHLDDYVANAILERLADANLLIAEKRGDSVGALQDERAGWVSKLDTLVDLLEDGTLDGPKARDKAEEYRREIAKIDRRLAAATRTSPVARMLASGQDVRERWEEMNATLRSQVIDELAVVIVLPTKRGRGFDPAGVDIRWKGDL